MKSKKSSAKKVIKTNRVTTRTWIMFGIFLFVSFLCLKVIANANQLTNSIVIPAPVAVPTISTVHKTVKK
jgi:cell division protein FtsX